jgi:hypothetical protein
LSSRADIQLIVLFLNSFEIFHRLFASHKWISCLRSTYQTVFVEVTYLHIAISFSVVEGYEMPVEYPKVIEVGFIDIIVVEGISNEEASSL